jgi:hypothetical protein
MKRFLQTWMAVSAVSILSTVALADGFSGNQLQGKALPPITERPATTVSSVEGVKAPKDGSLLTLQNGSVLYIVGDSTLHQYELGAKSLQGSAVVPATTAGLLKALTTGKAGQMTLVVPVTSLKSKESGLDDNAYKALKATENPEIRFTLKSEKVSADGVMTTKGSLTIAGTTQPITLTPKVEVKDGSVRLTGVQKLKMTDYGITPPSVSLVVTSITCTDEVSIHYDVTFATAKEEAAK